MSLYRKYRPQTFADVIGQDHVVTTLENATAQGKLAHAYLFAGGRGTGKTTAARILAKALLLKGVEDPAIIKQITEAIDDGNLVDLVEIDAASNRGIDDVRELIEKIQFSPVVAGAKVYIVDEAHMLTREAFNALLKTLEEPPAYAYFILATTELQKIPATIQSRCQRFAFKQINEEDIIRRLQFIADAEKITIDRPALRAVAHAAQGGMRDAISLLDQLRSLGTVTIEDVRKRTGETGQEHVEAAFAALDTADSSGLIATVRAVEEAGIALDVFARQLLSESRRRLHAAAESGEDLGTHVARVESLLGAIRDMRIAPVAGLALEAALLRINGVQSQAAPAIVSTPRPVAAKPVKVAEPAVESPAPRSEAPAEPSIASAAVEAPAVSLAEVKKQWPALSQAITIPSVKMSLKNGKVTEVRGDVIRIAFASAFHRDKVKQTEASRHVEELLGKIFSKPLRIECVLDGAGTVAPAKDENLVNLAEAASEVF